MLPPLPQDSHENKTLNTEKEEKVNWKGGKPNEGSKENQFTIFTSALSFWFLNLEEKTKRFKSLIITLQKQNNRYISISIYSY